jgi:hypothetical protein
MPVRLSEYFARPLSPLIERSALQFELRQFAGAQHSGLMYAQRCSSALRKK